jgi:crotonobetainyl-CoA:carnitine CoA-transferase CaiB-like acyl-CoA transferase
MSGPLAGIRVLDFTQFMQGPWATELLGDMGADVIKIEPPGVGDWEREYTFGNHRLNGESPLFLSLNRNKRSVVINLKAAEGRALVERLARDADVVVENSRPGVMARLGLDYERLRAIKPDIIYASATGYGPDGPYRQRPGQDLLIQGLSGLLSISGRAGEAPTACGTPIADAHGSRILALAIVLALFHRERSGEGQLVEVSLLDGLLATQTQELVTYLNGGPHPERSAAGIAHAYTAAPYGVYRTADGHITLAQAPMPKLAEALAAPDLAVYATLEAAYEHRDAIKERVQEILASQPSAHWLELLGAAGIWCGPVHSYRELADDPQIAHNGLFQRVEHPRAGTVTLVGSPIRMSATPPAITRVPPLLGEHTREVLRELGLEEATIEDLWQRGVVAGELA